VIFPLHSQHQHRLLNVQIAPPVSCCALDGQSCTILIAIGHHSLRQPTLMLGRNGALGHQGSRFQLCLLRLVIVQRLLERMHLTEAGEWAGDPAPQFRGVTRLPVELRKSRDDGEGQQH